MKTTENLVEAILGEDLTGENTAVLKLRDEVATLSKEIEKALYYDSLKSLRSQQNPESALGYLKSVLQSLKNDMEQGLKKIHAARSGNF